MDMRGEVTIAEIEPIGAPIAGQTFERMKSFTSKSPALSSIHNSRERVGDDVEVR